MTTRTTSELPRRRAGHVWTAEEVDALGVRTDLQTAGSIFGVGRTKAYTLNRAAAFPVPVLSLGSRFVVPTAAIRQQFGLPPLGSAVGAVVHHAPLASGQKEAA